MYSFSSRDPKSVPSKTSTSRPASAIPSMHEIPHLYVPNRYRSRSPPVIINSNNRTFGWYQLLNVLLCLSLYLCISLTVIISLCPPLPDLNHHANVTSSSPVPGFKNQASRPQTPSLPQTVFPPTNDNLYDDEDCYYPEPTPLPSLNIPLLTVTGPGHQNNGSHYGQPLPTTSFSPQPTRDAYQMEPDEETAAVLNQVSAGAALQYCIVELWAYYDRWLVLPYPRPLVKCRSVNLGYIFS